MRKQLAAITLAGLGLLSLSCERGIEARRDDAPAIRARTEIVQPAKVADYFQAPGTVRAKVSTVLSSTIAGQVLSIEVREGDRVRKGQTLIEIDSRDASAHLRRAQAAAGEARRAREEAERAVKAADAVVRAAEANRDLAASTKKRYDVLRDRRSVSPREYDEVETAYKAATLEVERSEETLAALKAHGDQALARIEQAEAEIEAAKVALGYSQIAAPIDGIVTARRIEPGMLATPGTPLLNIEDDRTYQLEVTVEESRAASIRIGQTARVEFEVFETERDSRVSEIVPAADPATRTYAVRLDLPALIGSRYGLRSGFFGRAFFPAADRTALTIPEPALIRRGQLDGVYIVQNDVCVFRLVKTGKRYGDRIEVLSGLDAGSRIVSAPGAGIADGVKVVEDTAREKTP